MTVPTTALADGYRVPRIIIGAWQLSAGHDAEPIDPARAVSNYVDLVRAGFHVFDGADIYTGVERFLGKVREEASRSLPDIEVRIHTKFVPDLDALAGLDRAYVRRIIERSLRRIGVETLDLVQFGWWDYAVPRYVEVAGWLEDLRREGLIQRLGATNFNVNALREILVAGIPIVTHQVQYSLLDRRPESGMVELCREHQVGLLCYGTLAGGLLSPRYLGQPSERAPFGNRSLVKYRLIVEEFGGWDAYQALLAELMQVAQQHGVSMGAVAIAWVLARPGATAAVVGARSTNHLETLQHTCRLVLDADDIRRLDALVAGRGPSGGVWDLERDRAGPHGRIMRYDLNE